MINLLPPELKAEYAYARLSAGLLKWCLIMVSAMTMLCLISVSGTMILKRSTTSYANLIDSSKSSLKAQKLDETQAQVTEISGNLKLVTQVLQREILFSKLLKQIGSAMPANTSLTDLKIGQTQGAIDLSAVASSQTTASQVQVNLSDPANKIFDKADIESITCNAGSSSDPRYPCTVDIKARFGKNSSFMFIQKAANK